MSAEHIIPQVQRAYILPVLRGELKLVTDHPVPAAETLLPGQCLVKLSHSGVCHSDLGIKNNLYENLNAKPDLIGGHEGIGVVVAIGAHTQRSSVTVGDRVGVKYMVDSCLSCEQCLKGWECYCPDITRGGLEVDGTFCEYTVSYVDHVTPIPDALDSADAAAIMCAGFTVYSALKQSETHIGDWVVIPGAGGGLGHLGVQYAVAMGLRVVAIDTGVEKRELCLELGAEKWIDFRESTDIVTEVISATQGGAHAAIVISGGVLAYEQAWAYLRRRGYLMLVGLPPEGILPVRISKTVTRGLTIRGVFIGGRQDAIEAVNIAAAGKVKCRYTVRGLSELEDVYKEIEEDKIVGRVVLDISK